MVESIYLLNLVSRRIYKLNLVLDELDEEDGGEYLFIKSSL